MLDTAACKDSRQEAAVWWGETGDEIDTDIADAGCPHPIELFKALPAGVVTADGGALGIHEALNPEAEPSDAVPLKRFEGLRRQLAGGALDSDLCAWQNREPVSESAEDLIDLPWLEQTRRASTEVDGVNLARQLDLRGCRTIAAAIDLTAESVYVGGQLAWRKGV